jgi:hypothetical protein
MQERDHIVLLMLVVLGAGIIVNTAQSFLPLIPVNRLGEPEEIAVRSTMGNIWSDAIGVASTCSKA